MMVTAIVQHKVKDYETWRAVFEENLPQLWKSGCVKAGVLRAVEDANDVTVIVSWPTLELMQAFFQSQQGSDSAVRAGVIGEPSGWIGRGEREYVV